MAWVGKITGFKQLPNGWEISVEYYNDVSPELKFPRSVNLPMEATKQQAFNLIQARGAEVRAAAKLNEEKFIGQIVPIP